MHDSYTEEPPAGLDDLLYAVVNRMLEPYGKSVVKPFSYNVLAGPQYPFDIKKPNEHDSKAEFQREYDAVSTSLECVTKLFETLLPAGDDEVTVKTRDQIRSVIDQKARVHAAYSKLDTSTALIRKNISDVGAYVPSLMVIADLKTTFIDRLQELESQKDRFWNLHHRAPDYHARALALRLAQLFASETGKRPTYGISGETGELSTDYSRALKEVFALLQISAQERGYAEWAISQITDEDLEPANPGILGSLLGTSGRLKESAYREIMGDNPLSKPKPK